jgi:hypothetical protein
MGLMEGGIFMNIIIESFEQFYRNVLQFLPNFFAFLLILIIGILLGRVLKALFSRIFRAVGLDKLSEKSGVMDLIRKGGIKDSISTLLAKLVRWITIVIFSIIALRALELPTIERIFEKLLLYLPNVFVAGAILLFGYLLGNFFGRAALIASVNAGIRVAGVIGRFVKFTVFLLAATMALEQLGIGKETIVIAFAIVFGGVVLALAIALGLGGRDTAKDYIEKKFKGEEEEEEKKDEISHL